MMIIHHIAWESNKTYTKYVQYCTSYQVLWISLMIIYILMIFLLIINKNSNRTSTTDVQYCTRWSLHFPSCMMTCYSSWKETRDIKCEARKSSYLMIMMILTYGWWTLYIIGFDEKLRLSHLDLNRKSNYNMGLFSSLFWLENSFCF